MTFDAGDIRSKMVLDRSDFRTGLDEAKREAQEFVDRDWEVRFTATLDTAEAMAEGERFRMAQAKNITIDEKVKTERVGPGLTPGSSGNNNSGGLLSGVNASQMLNIAPAGVGTISSLAPMLGMISIAAGGAGIALGAVGSVIATLPALALGGAVALGSLKLGMDGIKNASNQLHPQITALKTQMVSTFQTDFTPIFKQLGPVITAITPAMTGMAAGWAALAQAGTNAIAGPTGIGAINGLLTGVRSGMLAAAPGVQAFTTSLLGMGAAGAQALPQLGAQFATVTKNFQSLIQPLIQSGAVTGAVRDLGSALTPIALGVNQLVTAMIPLSPLLVGIGQILGGVVSQVASMAPMLGQAGAQLLSALMPLLPIIGQLGQALGAIVIPLLSALGPIVAALAPAFGVLAQALGAGLGDTITAIAVPLGQIAQVVGPALVQVVAAAAPLIGTFAQVVGVLAGALSSGIAAIMPTVVAVFRQLVPILQEVLAYNTGLFEPIISAAMELIQAVLPLLPPLLELVNIILPGLRGIVAQVAPVIGELAGILSKGLLAAMPVLQQIGNLLSNILGAAIKALLPILPPLATALMSIVNSLLPIIPPLLSIIQQLLPALAPLLMALTPIFAMVAQTIATLVPVLMPLIQIIVNLLMPIIKALLVVVQVAFTAIAKVIGDALRIVQGVVQLVMGLITGNWKEAWTGLKNIVGGAFNLIRDIIVGDFRIVYSYLSGVGGGILHAIGNLGGILYNIGKAIIEGLLNGLKAAWNAVTGFIGGIGNWISQHKGPIEYDAQLLIPHGNAILGGLITGMTAQMPALGRFLAGVSRTIGGSTFSLATPTLTGPVGQAAVNALVSMSGVGSSAGGNQGIATAVQQGVYNALNRASLNVSGTGAARLVANGNAILGRR